MISKARILAAGVAVMLAVCGVQPALAGTYDVGVVPDKANTCPSGSDYITIYMDDEDKNNSSQLSGWTGAISQQVTNHVNGTRLGFCRVNGQLFSHLGHAYQINWQNMAYGPTNAPVGAYDYSVLKLGDTCPPGSKEFVRQIENEKKNNQNTSSGAIAPNTQSGHITTLYFCLFSPDRTGAIPAMANFPDLGIGYGVFGGLLSPPNGSGHRNFWLQKGWVFTDDEDSQNSNYLVFPGSNQDLMLAAQSGVASGANSNFYVTRVRFRTMSCAGPVVWWNSAAPVPWFDGANCFVKAIPTGGQAFIYNNSYYIKPTPSQTCPIGTFNGSICFVRTRPYGAFILNNAGYGPAGSGNSCPVGSTYDGAHCLYFTAPPGTTALILGAGFYTTTQSTCLTGAYDGANCYLGKPPAGSNAFIYGSGFYYAEP